MFRTSTTRPAVVTAVAAIGLGLAGVSTAAGAQAAPDSGAYGRVTTMSGLTVRGGPSPSFTAHGTLPYDKEFPIACKVTGTRVYRDPGNVASSNNLWYLLPGGGLDEWVSALYVNNVGGKVPPYCGTDARFTGQALTTLRGREAPTTASRQDGTVYQGRQVSIICKLQGQNVDGNPFWYNLTDGRWLSARYVSNVGAAPGYCTS